MGFGVFSHVETEKDEGDFCILHHQMARVDSNEKRPHRLLS